MLYLSGEVAQAKEEISRAWLQGLRPRELKKIVFKVC
jgi:hypothetical protein